MSYDSREHGYYSDCCGAYVKWTDICESCGEHCDPIYEEEDEDGKEE